MLQHSVEPLEILCSMVLKERHVEAGVAARPRASYLPRFYFFQFQISFPLQEQRLCSRH